MAAAPLRAPRRRGDRHARRQLHGARAHLGRPARHPPGARRPRGDRPVQLGPPGPPRSLGAALPRHGPVVAGPRSSRWTATACTPSTRTGPRTSSGGGRTSSSGTTSASSSTCRPSREAAERLAEIAANPGRPSTDRLLLRHKDGHLMPFEVSVVGQVDESGRLEAIRGVARDIGERERLERELRAADDPLPVPRGERTRRRVQRRRGHEVRVPVGDHRAADGLPPRRAGRRVVHERSCRPRRSTWRSTAGARIAAEPDQAQAAPARADAQGRRRSSRSRSTRSARSTARATSPGVHGSARDIGERVRLEAELRASEERYRSVIQSSPDLIWATNRQGRYVFVSDRVRDLLGWEPEEVLGGRSASSSTRRRWRGANAGMGAAWPWSRA